MNKQVHKSPSIFKTKQGSVVWQKVVTKGSVWVFKNYLTYPPEIQCWAILDKSVAEVSGKISADFSAKE